MKSKNKIFTSPTSSAVLIKGNALKYLDRWQWQPYQSMISLQGSKRKQSSQDICLSAYFHTLNPQQMLIYSQPNVFLSDQAVFYFSKQVTWRQLNFHTKLRKKKQKTKNNIYSLEIKQFGGIRTVGIIKSFIGSKFLMTPYPRVKESKAQF